MIRHSANARVANADAGVARGASVLKRRYIVDRFLCCVLWWGWGGRAVLLLLAAVLLALP